MRLKVSDGDLIVVYVNAPAERQVLRDFSDHIKRWAEERGLQGVRVIMLGSETTNTRIEVLSVNDIFEEHILKKE